MGPQGRPRLSGAGRGAPVSLTEDPTEATERQWQQLRFANMGLRRIRSWLPVLKHDQRLIVESGGFGVASIQ